MATIEYHQTIHALSESIVAAQKPIRILDALKWTPEIKNYFFKHKFTKLPRVDASFYQDQTPLAFDPKKKLDEFREIDRNIRRHLGQFSGVGSIMQRMCHEYCQVVEMLSARGTPRFTEISQELYGSSDDAFHAGAPTLKDLAELVSTTLTHLEDQVITPADDKTYSSQDVVASLSKLISPNKKSASNYRMVLLPTLQPVQTASKFIQAYILANVKFAS
jgi:hypothetical protein